MARGLVFEYCLITAAESEALTYIFVVMDAAGWMCTAQGAYGLARMCFSAAVPFIAAWALASLFE